jgi:hypothetical protein
MPGLMLVLLLGAVLAVVPVRGEEGDCPEFECPAKVELTNNNIVLTVQDIVAIIIFMSSIFSSPVCAVQASIIMFL